MDFTEGIKALVLGLPTVFLVLIMISLVISLFSKFNFEKKPKNATVSVSPLLKDTEVDQVALKNKKNKMEELELVAIITSAIAAAMNTTTDQLEIISFREVNKETRGNWTMRK